MATRKRKTPSPPTPPAAPAAVSASLGSSRAGQSVLAGVHETVESVAFVELTPPHPPRETTPEYAQTHTLLIFEKDTPCKVCGVRHSDLQDPKRAKDPAVNPAGATAIESHHYPVERSLIDAVDWRKVHNDYPAVYSQASLIMWVDSPENMLILCDVHHRSPESGIHHLLTQDFAIQPYLLAGYQVAARAKDAATALATDEKIERAAGIEQMVDATLATASLGSASAGSPAIPPVVVPPTPVVDAPATIALSSSPAVAKPRRGRRGRGESSSAIAIAGANTTGRGAPGV